MARFNENKISYKKQVELLDEFCEVVSKLKTKAAIYNFFKDLLNRQERLMLIRRLLIAEMLLDKKKYSEISKELKCGSCTIARVQRWLNFGRGGYKHALKSIKEKSNKNK